MIKAAAYNCEAFYNSILFDEVYNLISPKLRQHVDEAKSQQQKFERLGAIHLLEKLLWENHIQRPYEYDITTTGKPVFLKPKGLNFSISHSDYVAVCAISDLPCGIDIERVRDYDRTVATKYFTKNDIKYLDECEKAKQAKTFTEIWTYKEAVCKMMDRPLVQIMQWVDYNIYSECSKGEFSWNKQGFEFQDYYITLCYQGERSRVEMGFYNPFDGKYY